mmetsp:Transcript_52445/g.111760  ORF Transcript_52445/g.111760 Transcript_52445/m.111760 type:complete len:80 (+) Transcript_52445:188-427(+)
MAGGNASQRTMSLALRRSYLKREQELRGLERETKGNGNGNGNGNGRGCLAATYLHCLLGSAAARTSSSSFRPLRGSPSH